jgi:hypothetical protein
MAFILFNDNTSRTLPADKALALWEVFSGNEPGTKAQQAFVRRVKRIYLNMATAPEDYRKRYEDGYIPSQSELIEERYR